MSSGTMNATRYCPQLLQSLIEGQHLAATQAEQLFTQALQGGLDPVQLAALVVALRSKGETVDEVYGAACAMRALLTPVVLPTNLDVVDLCGTGGDGAHTFNISTACMFVLAAAGVPVAKHGGRSVSSSCGSADVLEHLGVVIDLEPEQVAQCIQTLGLGFMFAPKHHSAMRHAAPVRKALGVRTVFNVLGPLTNPARARRQLMGVYSPTLLHLQAEVLGRLGSTHAVVVHGDNGMDELCLECDTQWVEWRDGQLHTQRIRPADLGLQASSHEPLRANTVEESAAKLRQALQGQGGVVADIVALNSAAGLYVAGRVPTLAQGLALARQVVASGAPLALLQRFVALTQQLRAENVQEPGHTPSAAHSPNTPTP